MIRFIDLRNQETGYRFAFFDTTREKFVEFAGDQAWNTAHDFAKSLKFQVMLDNNYVNPVEELDRFIEFIPMWAFDNTDDKE